jgi:hypothetical protein
MITTGPSPRSLAMVVLLGFVAGAVAVFTFHQITIWLLALIGGGQGNVYSVSPVAPFGVPHVLNQAFWGGLWGCVFAVLVDRFPRSWPLWLAGFIFGAIGPTLVGWFVVAPLKNQPIAQGFNPARMWRGPIINGMFGLGTAVFYDLLRRWLPGRTRWA